MITTL